MAQATNVTALGTCEGKCSEKDIELDPGKGVPRATFQDAEAQIRALLHAICTVDRELASRGVTHPILTKIVQDTQQQLPYVADHASCSSSPRPCTSDAFVSDHASMGELPQERSLDDHLDGESWTTATETVCDLE